MCYSVVGIEMKDQIGSKQLGLEGGAVLNPPHGAGCLSEVFPTSPLHEMDGNDTGNAFA